MERARRTADELRSTLVEFRGGVGSGGGGGGGGGGGKWSREGKVG